MIPKKYYILLIVVFLLTLSFRLYFSIDIPTFSSDESYFHVRQINHILETFKPITYDELSYSGRNITYPPLYHYLIALLSFISPIILKIFNEAIISSIVIIVFLISYQITKNLDASIFSSIIAGFSPIILETTLNKLSPYSLVLPLAFYIIYCLIMIKNEFFLWNFIILSFIFPLVHPSVFLILIALIFYMVILTSESLKLDKLKKEAILFFIFLSLLIELIMFKKVFLKYGLNIIWQNIPEQYFNLFFIRPDIFTLIYSLGVLNIILGVIALYFIIFKEKNKILYLMSSVILSTLILLWFKLIPISGALSFIATSLAILSSYTIVRFLNYLKITKFYFLRKFSFFIILVLVISFSIIPSLNTVDKIIKEQTPVYEVYISKWIRENTEKNSVVAAFPSEGHLISAIAKRKNMVDTYFLEAPNPAERLSDLTTLFQTPFLSKAIDITNKYNIGYILLTEKAKDLYGIEKLKYIDNKCFIKIKELKRVELYESKC